MDYERRESATPGYDGSFNSLEEWRAGPAGGRDLVGSMKLGDVDIDFRRRRVTIGAKRVSLTYIEWLLLSELARNAGRMVPHEELLTRVWGPEHSRQVHLLQMWISRLRYKLDENGHAHGFIRTVRKAGYSIGEARE